ncbi:MAG: hypothetical protein E6Q97_34165 [Desulfurellales bacterium]|nr:MAG: hypothetical protein E6Q97_34165 [Desulfurellales bacterium]
MANHRVSPYCWLSRLFMSPERKIRTQAVKSLFRRESIELIEACISFLNRSADQALLMLELRSDETSRGIAIQIASRCRRLVLILSAICNKRNSLTQNIVTD